MQGELRNNLSHREGGIRPTTTSCRPGGPKVQREGGTVAIGSFKDLLGGVNAAELNPKREKGQGQPVHKTTWVLLEQVTRKKGETISTAKRSDTSKNIVT